MKIEVKVRFAPMFLQLAPSFLLCFGLLGIGLVRSLALLPVAVVAFVLLVIAARYRFGSLLITSDYVVLADGWSRRKIYWNQIQAIDILDKKQQRIGIRFAPKQWIYKKLWKIGSVVGAYQVVLQDVYEMPIIELSEILNNSRLDWQNRQG